MIVVEVSAHVILRPPERPSRRCATCSYNAAANTKEDLSG
jgi:hypothetical protein